MACLGEFSSHPPAFPIESCGRPRANHLNVRTFPPSWGASMITYVTVFFSSDGPSPLSLAEKLEDNIGIPFIRGQRDIAFRWKTLDEFKMYMNKIYDTFKDSHVFLKFETVEEVEKPVHLLAQWPPVSNRKIDHSEREKLHGRSP